jgi:basic membrane protein A and related proteins
MGVAIVVVLLVVAAGAYFGLGYLSGTSSTSSTTSHTGSTTTTTTTTTTTGPLPGKGMSIGVLFDVGGLGDKGFNDLAYAGMIQANKTLGVNFDYRIAQTSSDFVPDLNALMAEHMTLIVANGEDMTDVINQTATTNPNQLFAITDADFPAFNHTNVIAMKWTEHVGSAIIGALSVAMTKSDKVGFLGGDAIGVIFKFWNGYKAGATWAENYLNKNVTIFKQYAGTTLQAFDDPTTGAQIATSMIGQGADVIYAPAGGTAIGAFNAIGQHDQQSWNWTLNTAPPVFGIGVDANQDYYGTYQNFVQHDTNSSHFKAPSFILTSNIKTVDQGVFSVMKSVVYHNYTNVWAHPETFAPSFWNGQTQICVDYGSPCHVRGVWQFTLETGSVGPTNFQYTSQYLTPAAQNVLKQITQGILNGSITIPENYNDTPA